MSEAALKRGSMQFGRAHNLPEYAPLNFDLDMHV
jgi:hypothetical protein